jgi:hypothetical protein
MRHREFRDLKEDFETLGEGLGSVFGSGIFVALGIFLVTRGKILPIVIGAVILAISGIILLASLVLLFFGIGLVLFGLSYNLYQLIFGKVELASQVSNEEETDEVTEKTVIGIFLMHSKSLLRWPTNLFAAISILLVPIFVGGGLLLRTAYMHRPIYASATSALHIAIITYGLLAAAIVLTPVFSTYPSIFEVVEDTWIFATSFIFLFSWMIPAGLIVIEVVALTDHVSSLLALALTVSWWVVLTICLIGLCFWGLFNLKDHFET